MTYTPTQIQEFYKKLDQKTREIIASAELTITINSIGKSHNLTEKQVGDVGQLITYVLVNIEDKNNITKKIKESLSVDENTASQIAKDVQDKILNNITGLHQMIEENIRAENLKNGIVEEEEEENTDNENPITFSRYEKRTRTPLESRIQEIGRKYSLDDIKTDLLITQVTKALANPEEKEKLTETLITTLDISRLLTEQIISDLKTRVFEYTIKSTENKKTEVPKPSIAEPTPQVNPVLQKPNVFKETSPVKDREGSQRESVFNRIKTEMKKTEGIIIHPPHVPEIRPINPVRDETSLRALATSNGASLPMVEKGEVAHDVPPAKQVPQVPENLPGVAMEKEPAASPKVRPLDASFLRSDLGVQKPEPVQRPIPVPRFVAEPLEEGNEIPIKKPETTPKVSTPVMTPTPPVVQPVVPPQTTQPLTEKPPEKKYVADPYREPIE